MNTGIVLQEPSLREAERRVSRHDEVIEDLHVNQRQSLFEGLGQHFVGPARLSDPGRVVVGEDHGRRICGQSAFHDLSRCRVGYLLQPEVFQVSLRPVGFVEEDGLSLLQRDISPAYLPTAYSVEGDR